MFGLVEVAVAVINMLFSLDGSVGNEGDRHMLISMEAESHFSSDASALFSIEGSEHKRAAGKLLAACSDTTVEADTVKFAAGAIAATAFSAVKAESSVTVAVAAGLECGA